MGRSLIPNSTQIPDVILDQWMSALTGAELKVLLYVARRTYGFGKERDRISLQQLSRGIRRRDGSVLDYGTGLSVSSVARAAKSLEERGLLFRQLNVDDATGEHNETTYSLNLGASGPLGHETTRGQSPPALEVGKRVLPESENVLPASCPGPSVLGGGVLPGCDPQETDQDTEQETAAQAAVADLVSALVSHDLNHDDAVRLATIRPEECRRQLTFLPFKRTELRGSPGAWLRCAIEGGYGPPVGYRRAQAEAGRRAQAEANDSRRQALSTHEITQRPAYEAYLDHEMGEMPVRRPELWSEFEAVEAQTRASRGRSPLSAANLARCLAVFDEPGSRRERFAAFFGERALLMNFWDWDRTLNRQPFTTSQLSQPPGQAVPRAPGHPPVSVSGQGCP